MNHKYQKYIPHIYGIQKGVHSIYKKIITPKSKNEDTSRSEFILNIILVSSIIFSLYALLSALYQLFFQGLSYKGNSALISLILFSALYFTSRKGYIKTASHILVLVYFIPIIFLLYAYGTDLPQGLLTLALIIVIGGILISNRYALIITAACVIIINALSYLQNNNIILQNIHWKTESSKISGSTHAATLAIIMIVICLYNREIKKSLTRARKSEKALLKEKKNLEIKVIERTEDLKKEQTKRISELYHLYEFGQLSGGIFHDLVNRLQSVYLNIEDLNCNKIHKNKLPKNIQQIITDTNNNLKNVKIYLNAAQKQIKQEDTQGSFSIFEEIKDCIQITNYKSKLSGAKIHFRKPNTKISIHGNKFKFNQLLINIISNATDACAKAQNKKKSCAVYIEARKEHKKAYITIKDTGTGIAKEVKDKIFNPFFTTKKTMGLGLYTTKNIIERDFNGIIDIKSKVGEGTTVTIVIPIKT
ncbi:HAMP domain-containing histidine kinase [Patescibacteria group bacterium]|nr:HAMP domain-containing histidine kinase [Patescibacteria group bacterium]